MAIDTAVVLAAGEGNRSRPLTHNRPKPMLPAANRPILEHVLDTLVAAGMEQIVVVVGYKRNRVQEYFGHSYRGIELTYVHQPKQLGSGHALLRARSAVEGPFVAVNGDRVLEPEMVEQVIATFEETGDPTLAVLEHPDTSEYGAVALDGDRVTELEEKPVGRRYRLINAGVYAFSREFFDVLEAAPRNDGELPLPDVLATAIDDGETVRGVLAEGLWVDATYPWDLLYLARELLLNERVAEPERDDGVYVAESALVHDSATLVAPVVVGADAEIGAGAVVGPDAAVGRNATVGANATVQRSVLDADTRVGPTSTLLDAVTGQDVDLGAGTLVPGGLADVRVGTKVFENQRLGAVFADRVTAAGGVTCAPGSLVGAAARLKTGATVDGEIESEEVVR